MLKKLELHNFQGHIHTVLEFVPGVNVIFGLSRHGKTAIIRAAKWLFGNRPMGGNFFSNFAGDEGILRVAVELDDCPPISLQKRVRVKDGEKVADTAIYQIGKEEFKGVGREVPDVIQAALRISEINVQDQLDGPFLIASPPGEVGRAINKITKVEEADVWSSKLTTKVNTTTQEIEILKAQLEEKRVQLKEYADLPKIEKKIQALVDIRDRLLEAEKIKGTLEHSVEQYTDINNELSRVEARLKVEEKVILLVTLREQIVRETKEQDLLEELVAITSEVSQTQIFLVSEKKIEVLTKLLDTIEEEERKKDTLFYLKKELEDIVMMEESKETFLQSEERITELQQINQNIFEYEVQSNSIRRKAEILVGLSSQEDGASGALKKLEIEYEGVLQKMKICPFCFSEIDEKKITEILGKVV